MPKELLLASPDRFFQKHGRLASELHGEAHCSRWGLTQGAFAECLRRSAARRFGGEEPDAHQLEAYLRSLWLEDLALACACGEGLEGAWEFFVAHFRQNLRDAAGAMLRSSGIADPARAVELADSLYADLYGVRSNAGGRGKSLFEYFHGRSKLSTWLRAVLAQKQVDLFRTSNRTISLQDEPDSEAQREPEARSPSAPADPDRERYLARIEMALAAGLAALAPRERMVLACYYVDQRTLAEIGKMFQEHESTVSRQLDRIRQTLRERVTDSLTSELPARNGRAAEPALDAAQVELAFEYAVDDWPFDLSQALSAPAPALDPPDK